MSSLTSTTIAVRLRDALDDFHYCRVHQCGGGNALLRVLDSLEIWDANSTVRLAMPDAPQVENELAAELGQRGAEVVCFQPSSSPE